MQPFFSHSSSLLACSVSLLLRSAVIVASLCDLALSQPPLSQTLTHRCLSLSQPLTVASLTSIAFIYLEKKEPSKLFVSLLTQLLIPLSIPTGRHDVKKICSIQI
ncbi:hypothetical protein AAHE18_10G134500 [Arachis hypogaea]|nr:uncharacterized protein LOC112715750 isoform X2 [Arachis hypogaea]QHO16308.1 uncharacterized protein DS421_10g302490 [Arachis hypogaea]